MKAAEKRARKRQSKEHSQRVRAREKELRRGNDYKPELFWGSPGQTYESGTREGKVRRCEDVKDGLTGRSC